MGKSQYLATKNLDENMGKTAFTMPTAIYAALLTVQPTASDTGSTVTEATYTGYARKQVQSSDLNAASAGSMTNANDIIWPGVTSGSDTIVSIAFFDASTGGNMLYFDENLTPFTVSTSLTPPTLDAGTLTISES